MSQSSDTAEKPLVLIADDDPDHCSLIQDFLEESGFRVVTAPDGKVALELYSKLQPDVVLLDVETPEGLDGFSVCDIIRARETIRESSIFIITESEDDESVERAYTLGATDFIVKPIALPVLAHRIRYALRTCRSLNDLRGLIRAVPDLIFIVNAEGEVEEGLSGPARPILCN